MVSDILGSYRPMAKFDLLRLWPIVVAVVTVGLLLSVGNGTGFQLPRSLQILVYGRTLR
jgi:hypothetical protein